MRGPKYPVQLKDAEREALQKIIAKRTEKCNIVLRAKIIIMAGQGMRYGLIAEEVIKQGIVESISSKHIGTLLKKTT